MKNYLGNVFNCNFFQYLFLILIFFGILGLLHLTNYFQGELPKKDTYQAITLMNGQTVYGKLVDLDKEYAVLYDIYYLKENKATVDPKTGEKIPPKNPFELLKFGVSEADGPEDVFHVNSKNILHWINLRKDSALLNGIKQYKISVLNNKQVLEQNNKQVAEQKEQKLIEDKEESDKEKTDKKMGIAPGGMSIETKEFEMSN